MKTLGFVVCDKKIRDLEPYLKQVSDLLSVENGLPYIIVGWDSAKSHPSYHSVIDRRLDENSFWTFKKTESRVDFERDMDTFCDYVVNSFVSKIKYYYINILRITRSKLKKLLYIVNSSEEKNIYLSNGMVYIPHEDNVYGVSFSLCEYCGISKSRILDIVSRCPYNNIVECNGNCAKVSDKRLINKRYAIPYLV